MKVLLDLFLTFLKIGAFSFGGGYAMLPFIEREVVTNHKWISYQQFIDIIGISQMTPGPIAINSATFIGYRISGIFGSIFATFGVVIFSFILVSIASHYILKFKNSALIKSAFTGMRPAMIALIISAFISLAKQSYGDMKSIVISIIVIIILLSKKIHPILVIAISGLLGIVCYGIL